MAEPTEAETVEILKGLRDRYEAHHRIRIADEALYRAKADGRNRVVYLGEVIPGSDPTAAETEASPQTTNETGVGVKNPDSQPPGL